MSDQESTQDAAAEGIAAMMAVWDLKGANDSAKGEADAQDK
ncbi:hypothetical protein [Nocardia sp. NPDC051981]